MTRYFNIRDNDCDLSYPYHLIHTDTFCEIADSFNLELSLFINLAPTHNSQDLNLVIDLMFFHENSEEFNNHQISSDLRRLSNHALLSVSIIIEEEFI